MATVGDLEADREHAHKSLDQCAAKVEGQIAWRKQHEGAPKAVGGTLERGARNGGGS